jgi:hypothetical protein
MRQAQFTETQGYCFAAARYSYGTFQTRKGKYQQSFPCGVTYAFAVSGITFSSICAYQPTEAAPIGSNAIAQNAA